MDALSSIFQFYINYGEQSILPYLLSHKIDVAFALLFFFYLIYRLRTKRFYFVRHGQTVLNESHIKQGDEGGLNTLGQEQAERTGEYLMQFSTQRIYASPYERAVQTAKIIDEHLKVGISYSPLLIERRNPSETIGKSVHDTEVKRIMDLIDLSYHADDLRYSDEENFEDLKDRARKCLRYLERRFPRRIVVVTHGVFLKMLISYILSGEGLHNSAYIRMSFFNAADNGGITICEYTPWKRWLTSSGGWKVLIYNQNLTK